MAKKHPERPTFNLVREEGTAFHEVASMCVKNEPLPSDGTLIGDGVYMTDEILEHAEEYAWEILSWNAAAVFIEQPLACSYIHPMCGGTPDGWGYCPVRRKIWLIDAKYGYRPVPADGNWQLGVYLAGILEVLPRMGVPMNGMHEQYWTVEFIIYQPRGRGFAFSRAEFNVADYARGVFNQLRAAAHAATQPDAPCVAGEHCLDCPAAFNCGTLRSASMAIIDVVEKQHSERLTGLELGFELDLVEYAESILTARKQALEVEAEYRLRESGEPVPGRTLAPVRGRLAWVEGGEEKAIMAAQILGKDIRKPSQAVTPTQAIKIIGQDLVDQFAKRPDRGLKLAPLTAKDIKKVFEK